MCIAALNRTLRERICAVLELVDEDAAVDLGNTSDETYAKQKLRHRHTQHQSMQVFGPWLRLATAVSSSVSFARQPGFPTRATRTVEGPYNANFDLTIQPSEEQVVWSPCGKKHDIAVQSRFAIRSPTKGEWVGVDLCDTLVGGTDSKLSLQVDWRTCEPDAAPATPTTSM